LEKKITKSHSFQEKLYSPFTFIYGGRKMKKLFGILVAVLLFASTLPIGNADGGDKGIVKCYVISAGKIVKREAELTKEEALELIEKIWDAVYIYKPYKDRENMELTPEEKSEIESIFNDLFSEMKKLGLLPENEVSVQSLGLLPDFGISFLNPILSCGVGKSFIPLYPGEAFIGVMLRPIFVQYLFLGYTGCINARLIPPRLEYWDWVGTQTLMIWGFVGLYIDFASIGLGIPPMQVLMGESFFTAGIDWL